VNEYNNLEKILFYNQKHHQIMKKNTNRIIDDIESSSEKEMRSEELYYPQDVVDTAKEMSYFYVEPPSNIVDGLLGAEYNLIKGAIAGPLLLATAPFSCALEEASKGKVA
jgi:hypothetical protein